MILGRFSPLGGCVTCDKVGTLCENLPLYIALYSGDLSLVAIDIMGASIVLYSIIIATIAKSVFPDGCHFSLNIK